MTAGFVEQPDLDPVAGPGLDALRELVSSAGVAVLSGAGLSTESGIPDYRGPTGARRTSTPMTYQEFVGSAAARRRYWGRSYLGWTQIATARPNEGHRAVARLQRQGRLAGIITQNVDGLHQAAGAHDVVELHGGLDLVVCLACGLRERRTSLGERLRAANPGFGATVTRVNPDGDADIDDAELDGFALVGCTRCDSDLVKPDVVFFGENVPKPRVATCYDIVEGARSLLVLGSSLTVMSGLRFVRRAAKLGIPVAIVNQGETRGDPLADVKVAAPLGRVLAALAG
ncbi:NAD-dependent protein deacetylase [Jatrophihabitans endophyticus]|uniref:NAD-dependent protein deacetylase n=1 Tax=Jatrophihabitans endophyticus TaxID=1206085 RepID=UPI000A039121|nr:NAD-dependent protein deacetylase [Jatrophihabitans endophyticus]